MLELELGTFEKTLESGRKLTPEEAARHSEWITQANALGATTSSELPGDLHELKIAVRYARMKRDYTGDPSVVYELDRFEVLDCFTGGMGMVLEARDKLGRKVALKMWFDAGPAAERQILAEAKILAKLDHPNIVRVYGDGEWNGRTYFVMEWIEGRNGATWLQGYSRDTDARTAWLDEVLDAQDGIETPEPVPPGWREVRDKFVQAARGLAAAHRAFVQHCDFKPSNMLIGDDGRVVVADFGVAASIRSSKPEYRSGGIAGTPTYMAPERINGGEGDGRSDQFSFCVALWEGLHRRAPFAGRTIAALLASIEDYAIEPGDPRVEVPGWLSEVVRRGLHPDPERRFASMDELIDALTDEPSDEEWGDEEEERELLGDGRGYLHAPDGDGADERPRWRTGFAAGMAVGGVAIALVAAVISTRPAPTPRDGVFDARSSPAKPTLINVQRAEWEIRLDAARTALELAQTLETSQPLAANLAVEDAINDAMFVEAQIEAGDARAEASQIRSDAEDLGKRLPAQSKQSTVPSTFE